MDLLIQFGVFALAGIVGAILMAVIRSELEYSASETPDASADKGSVTLDYGPAIKILAWCAGLFFFGVAVLWVVVFALDDQPKSGWVITPCTLLFVVLGLLPLLEVRSSTTLGARGLSDYKTWRGHRFMPWASVRKVRFSAVNGWFVIADDSGQVFRITRFRRGIPQLARFCEVHLDPAVYGNAFDKRWSEL